MYKIIKKDNLDREIVSDILLEENLTIDEANKIFNEKYKKLNSENSFWYYKIVSQDYELFDHTDLF